MVDAIDENLYKKFGKETCIKVYELLEKWVRRTKEISVEDSFDDICKSTINKDKQINVNTINLLVELISKCVHDSCCIDKTIVKAILLFENGYDFQIVYGVVKVNERLEGHAWIEMMDGNVLDRDFAYKSCRKVLVKKIKPHEMGNSV